MNNHHPQSHYNPKNAYKYHSSQYSNPVSSSYHISPGASRNHLHPLSSSTNVYNFNQNHSPRDEYLRRNYPRQNVKMTTFL